jgi:hypothetical protein
VWLKQTKIWFWFIQKNTSIGKEASAINVILSTQEKILGKSCVVFLHRQFGLFSFPNSFNFICIYLLHPKSFILFILSAFTEHTEYRTRSKTPDKIKFLQNNMTEIMPEIHSRWHGRQTGTPNYTESQI